MIIVGLTGGIGHGKTTFASLLADQSRLARHFESWELIAEVGNALRTESPTHPSAIDIDAINQWLLALPDIVQQCMHTTISYSSVRVTSDSLLDYPERYAKLLEYLELMHAQPELAQVEITQDNKETLRPLLQWLGGFLVITGGSGIWYDEILRRVTHLQLSGTDLVTVGGVRYPADAERLRNAGGMIIQIERPALPIQDANDITERDRNLITPDATVNNNGTLSDLAACAQTVCHDLQTRNLQTRYAAADTAGQHTLNHAIN